MNVEKIKLNSGDIIFLFHDHLNIMDLPKITEINDKFLCFHGSKNNRDDYLLYHIDCNKILNIRREISNFSLVERFKLKDYCNIEFNKKELLLFNIFHENIYFFNNKSFELLLTYCNDFTYFLKELLNNFIPNYNELKTIYLYYQLAISMGKSVPNIKYENGRSKKNYEIFIEAYKSILNKHIKNIEEEAKKNAKELSLKLNTSVKYRLKDGYVEFFFRDGG